MPALHPGPIGPKLYPTHREIRAMQKRSAHDTPAKRESAKKGLPVTGGVINRMDNGAASKKPASKREKK